MVQIKKKDSNFFYSNRGFRIHPGELKSFQACLLPSRLNRCALQARSSVAILSVSLLLVQACLLPSRLKPLCASGRRTFKLGAALPSWVGACLFRRLRPRPSFTTATAATGPLQLHLRCSPYRTYRHWPAWVSEGLAAGTSADRSVGRRPLGHSNRSKPTSRGNSPTRRGIPHKPVTHFGTRGE